MRPTGKGLVLVVEDSASHRRGLEIVLKENGFDVIAVSGANEAREAVHAMSQREFDVAILDMNLRDPGARTGAALGRELRSLMPAPPEFLIYSAFGPAEYYQEALELGVEAYVSKSVDYYELAIHISALALKHRLTLIPDELRATRSPSSAGSSDTQPVLSFCNDYLLPQLRLLTPIPVLLVVKETKDQQTCTWVCGDPRPIVASRDIDRVARAPLSSSGFSEPRMLDRQHLEALDVTEPRLGHGGVCLAPLAELSHRGVDTSVVLIGTALDTSPRGSHRAAALCKALLRYSRRSIQQVLNVVSELTIAHSERHQRLIVANTATIFLKLGQEILFQLQEYHRGFPHAQAAHLEKVEELAADLRDAGELLEEIGRPSLDSQHREVDIPALLREVWLDITARLETTLDLRIEGTAEIVGDREGIQLGFSEILSWLMRQNLEQRTPRSVRIECSQTDTEAVLEISYDAGPDRAASRKQPLIGATAVESLRPGPQMNLSLARVVLAQRVGGVLEDRSRDRPDLTFFFRVSLPRVPPQMPRVM